MSAAVFLLCNGLVVLSVFGVGSIFVALHRSSEGWEDDRGFHEGESTAAPPQPWLY